MPWEFSLTKSYFQKNDGMLYYTWIPASGSCKAASLDFDLGVGELYEGSDLGGNVLLLLG
jgi:hypothetical protein